ncbi:Protein FD, partial [Mucuna pruriens]
MTGHTEKGQTVQQIARPSIFDTQQAVFQFLNMSHSKIQIQQMVSSSTSTRGEQRCITKPPSLPSHFSHQAMEDVWEGINLASPNDHTTSKGAKFQDFLAIATDPSPPMTALSLGTRPEFHFDPLGRKDLQLGLPHHNPTPKLPPFRNLASGDTRNARLIKNRESAARSRARKQEIFAYVFELKQKIKHLQEENARLRRQQQLC